MFSILQHLEISTFVTWTSEEIAKDILRSLGNVIVSEDTASRLINRMPTSWTTNWIEEPSSFQNKFLQDLIENSSVDRKSTRLNSSHTVISYAVFCLKKK